MRHGKKVNHLSRQAPHRKAMLANMASSLILHKRINTTVAKAKALRKYVEPLVTKSKSDTTHSRRVVFSYLRDKYAVTELFSNVAVKVGDRPGGYTRIIKTGYRLGDNADMCMMELVDYNEIYGNEKKKTTRRSRRGKKKADGGTVAAAAGAAAATATDAGKSLLGKVKDTASAAVDKAGDAVEAVKDTAEAAVDKAGDVVDAVKDKAGDAVDAVKDTAEAAVDKAGDAVEAIKDKASDVKDAVTGKDEEE